MTEPPVPRSEQDARYEIRIQGHLDAHWDDWFEGFTVTNYADGTTTLSGVVVDQAGLHGLLAKVGGLGMTLISVKAVNSDQST
jgi:hypothetical protein